ncbi:hypothetical protein FE784_29055 [Paenibacillus hemerocallicola]|uniref:Uncharacterized protein n=1 Tax=Paenibacillus hemerocallicola TaxID=1172614 RepID=A0A5C4T179_9BACL|nr:hypothetical protein [Paenibacillus hemerocallicola]TNJ62696.1 hypothetical protein FE784_29055 [Paenibacillus hemerocallicola]
MFRDEWWGAGLNAVVFAASLLLLVLFYRKRQEEEAWLPAKLFGYSVLGAFTFSLNELRLPLGFAVFLLFVVARPKLNREAKHRAAYLGLCLFLLQWIAPSLEKSEYERVRIVPAAEMNMYDFDFAAHWSSVTKKFQLSGETRLERFEAGYKADGALLQMHYEGIERRPEGNYDFFRIELEPEKTRFKISRRQVKEWVQYDRSVSIRRFFRQLDDTELASLKPGTDFHYYGLQAEGSSFNYGIKEGKKYVLEETGGIREIDNSSLPVRGYWLKACGDRLMQSSNRVGCEERVDYLFDAVLGKTNK